MSSHRTSVSRRFTWRAAWLATSLLVVGCSDRSLVSPGGALNEPRPEEPDAVSLDMAGRVPDMGTLYQPPLGAVRQFEWRAKLPVDPEILKFVGMNGTRPVFLRRADGRATVTEWSVWNHDLSKPDPLLRMWPGSKPDSFPRAPILSDFAETQVAVSDNSFYQLSRPSSSIELLGVGPAVLTGVTMASPLTYFRHPELAVLAVNLQPTGGASAAKAVGWPGNRFEIRDANEFPATVQVIGDLDVRDRLGNGLESISIDRFHVQAVLHQEKGSAAGREDTSLQAGLQNAIVSASPGSNTPIDAAFIVDLNADGFTDFVYIRGGQLFVTSYRGRNGSGLSVFESWPSVTLSSVGGESVRSLAAIDLSQDGYPELVVETGKAVHFYLNKP